MHEQPCGSIETSAIIIGMCKALPCAHLLEAHTLTQSCTGTHYLSYLLTSGIHLASVLLMRPTVSSSTWFTLSVIWPM